RVRYARRQDREGEGLRDAQAGRVVRRADADGRGGQGRRLEAQPHGAARERVVSVPARAPRVRDGRMLCLSTELAVPSPLYFGHGLVDELSSMLDLNLAAEPADRIFLIADPTVAHLHPELWRSLAHRRELIETIFVDPGEASKSWTGLA